MNKHKVLLLVGVALMIILLFPCSTGSTISGCGEVINLENKNVEDCTLLVEIRETRSLLFCYKKQFSYTINGEKHKDFVTSSHTETGDGICLISQMYYDEQNDDLKLCSLVYLRDLSYAMVQLDTGRHCIRNVYETN